MPEVKVVLVAGVEMELKWGTESDARWSVSYSSRRDVRTNLGSLFRQEAYNCRTANLDFTSGAPNELQVSLSHIVDEAASEDGKPFKRSLGDRSYPLLNLSASGEILRNFYPRNKTFPLVWVPPLRDLTIGQPRRTPIMLSLKSGFRWVPTKGSLETRVECADDGLIKISTAFELVSTRGLWFSGIKPTSFRGRSEYLFDHQAGRMLRGEASSELEQDLLFFHFQESWQMKLGLPVSTLEHSTNELTTG